MSGSIQKVALTGRAMEKALTLDDPIRQGRERLFPSLTNPNWLVLRARRKIFQRWLEQLPSRELDVLDVGGRLQPYRPLIGNRLRRYTAVDLRLTSLVNVVARAEDLPLADARFDLVICTQMLEYAPHPSLVVAEIYRVLKPGGRLLLSVPSAAPDAGEESWRLLPAGLRTLLSAFRNVAIVAEGGSVAGLFRTANVCFDIFARYPAARFVYRHTVCPVVNIVGALLDNLSGRRNEQFAVNYSALAEK
jgi:SAM-dependent methyltransferase